MTCDFCGASFGLPKYNEIPFATDWDRSDDLQKLVDQTNPELSQIESNETPTDAQILALLSTIKEKASVVQANVLPGLIVGAISAPFLTVPIGLLLYWVGVLRFKIDLFGHVFSFILAGIVIGSIVGSLIYGRRKSLKIVNQALDDAIQKHELEIDVLWETCRTSHLRLGRVHTAVEAKRNTRG